MIGVYHSGADVAWGEQVLAVACLGGEPSSSVFTGLYGRRGGVALSGVRIRRISGANGVGLGSLVATGPDALAWRAPGASEAGAGVSLPVDGEVVLPGANPAQYVVVYRGTAAPLLSRETVQIMEGFGGAVGGLDVGNAARVAGVNKYSQVIVRNDGAAAWTALKAWVDVVSGGEVSVGWMATGDDELISDDEDAPTGVTWEADTSEGSAQDAGAVAVGAWKRLWIRREVAADSDANAARRVRVQLKAVTASGSFVEVLHGLYRVEGVGGKAVYAVKGRLPTFEDTAVWVG